MDSRYDVPLWGPLLVALAMPAGLTWWNVGRVAPDEEASIWILFFAVWLIAGLATLLFGLRRRSKMGNDWWTTPKNAALWVLPGAAFGLLVGPFIRDLSPVVQTCLWGATGGLGTVAISLTWVSRREADR